MQVRRYCGEVRQIEANGTPSASKRSDKKGMNKFGSLIFLKWVRSRRKLSGRRRRERNLGSKAIDFEGIVALTENEKHKGGSRIGGTRHASLRAKKTLSTPSPCTTSLKSRRSSSKGQSQHGGKRRQRILQRKKPRGDIVPRSKRGKNLARKRIRETW